MNIIMEIKGDKVNHILEIREIMYDSTIQMNLVTYSKSDSEFDQQKIVDYNILTIPDFYNQQSYD